MEVMVFEIAGRGSGRPPPPPIGIMCGSKMLGKGRVNGLPKLKVVESAVFEIIEGVGTKYLRTGRAKFSFINSALPHLLKRNQKERKSNCSISQRTI